MENFRPGFSELVEKFSAGLYAGWKMLEISRSVGKDNIWGRVETLPQVQSLCKVQTNELL